MTFNRRNFLMAAGIGAVGITTPALLGKAAPLGAGRREPLSPFPGTQPPAAAKPVDQPAIVQRALAALDAHGDRIVRRDVMGVVDFAQHSSKPRFHLIDTAEGRVAATYLVAHGKGSDPGHSGYLQEFSNVEGSNATSRGSYLVANTYYGKYGRARRLEGLDPDNNHAFERAIVLHGASYVSPDLIETQGKIGRSFGCFSVAESEIGEVLDRLPEGCLLYADRV